MGLFAEDCAGKYSFSREEQDAFAIESTRRTVAANIDGSFKWEMTPVTIAGRKGDVVVDKDEIPCKANPAKIPTLKPAFHKDGTVTAATLSSIADGATALVLMRESTAKQLGGAPIARVVTHATHSQEPQWFTTPRIGAIEKLYKKTDRSSKDMDLFEINKAFAVVVMAAMKEHNLSHDRVNVHGGACALGHPTGALGARLIVTLIGAMRQRKAKRGIATLCIGGGEATAVAIELA